MSLVALKLILTPLLIGAATLVARRWGPGVGGWLAGLPLTSGPVSVFFALEQGPPFAAQAAQGTILGLVAVTAFCVAYARGATVTSWPGSVGLGLGLYVLVTFALSRIAPGFLASVLFTALLLCVGLIAVGGRSPSTHHSAAPRWDLALRMIAATVIVLALTGGAQQLGPGWSGLLSPFPVFAGVMAVFSHRQGGAGAAQHLLRGVIIGSFAFGSFFVVIAAVVQRIDLWAAYLLAACAALVVNGLTLITLMRADEPARRARPLVG